MQESLIPELAALDQSRKQVTLGSGGGDQAEKAEEVGGCTQAGWCHTLTSQNRVSGEGQQVASHSGTPMPGSRCKPVSGLSGERLSRSLTTSAMAVGGESDGSKTLHLLLLGQ